MTVMSTTPAFHKAKTATFETSYFDEGTPRDGHLPVLLIHGSGPGADAWSNWMRLTPKLAPKRRVFGPDLAGFGNSSLPKGFTASLDRWAEQLAEFLDFVKVPQVDVVGNSLGGGIALALALRLGARVRRLVLMGSIGVKFPITKELDGIWGYQPSAGAMRDILSHLAFNQAVVTDEIVDRRFKASTMPGRQESYAKLFPAPRQHWVDAMAFDEKRLRALPHETLIIHGREDRVIPLQCSLDLHQRIPKSELHVFGRCGHWTQLECAERFAQLVENFFDAPGGAPASP